MDNSLSDTQIFNSFFPSHPHLVEVPFSSGEIVLWLMLQAVVWMWRNAGIILSMRDLLQF